MTPTCSSSVALNKCYAGQAAAAAGAPTLLDDAVRFVTARILASRPRPETRVHRVLALLIRAELADQGCRSLRYGEITQTDDPRGYGELPGMAYASRIQR